MTDDHNFDDFLQENYRLFAVMGVFGTVALYLTRLADDAPADQQPTLRLGVLASLLLFAFTALYVNRRVLDGFDSVPALLRALVARRGLAYALFLVPFDVLVVTVVLTALDFPRAVPVVGGSLAFVAGFVGFNEAASRVMAPVAGDPDARGTDDAGRDDPADDAGRDDSTDGTADAGGARGGRFAVATVALSAVTAAGAALALHRVPAVAVGRWLPPGGAGSTTVATLGGPLLVGVALSAGVTALASLALAAVVLANRSGN